jgi:hypothetical protein
MKKAGIALFYLKGLSVSVALLFATPWASATTREFLAAKSSAGFMECFEWQNGRPAGYSLPDSYCATGRYAIKGRNALGWYVCYNVDSRGVAFGSPVSTYYCQD